MASTGQCESDARAEHDEQSEEVVGDLQGTPKESIWVKAFHLFKKYFIA